MPFDNSSFMSSPDITWIIVGGESGSKRRPFDCDWARTVRTFCDIYGIPFFFKQVDKVQPIPEDLEIRELPNCYTILSLHKPM